MSPRRPRRHLVGGLALLLVIAAVGVAIAFRSGTTSASGLQNGDSTPAFSTATISGERVTLRAKPGRPVIVTFGASWCGPCRKEYPLLVDALRRNVGKFDIIGVAYRDSRTMMASLMEDTGASWPVADDRDGTIAARFSVHNVPATFFVAADGTIVSVGYGLTTAAALERPLQELLSA